jgi:hypothetical protein
MPDGNVVGLADSTNFASPRSKIRQRRQTLSVQTRLFRSGMARWRHCNRWLGRPE